MLRIATLLATIALTFGFAGVAAGQEGASCTPAPRTGCFQSAAVELRVSRSPERVDWSWQGAAPVTDVDFALCLYAGERTAQTEVTAPSPESNSLVLGVPVSRMEADAQTLSAEVGAEGPVGLTALDSVDGNQIISQLQGTELCFGKSISIAYANGPPFPESGNGVMDSTKGKQLLDELAAEYNAEFGGDGLSMMRWIAAVAATQIQNRVVRGPHSELDLEAVFGALHIAGWFGGTWFARDGFQRPAPDAVDPAAAEGAVRSTRRAGMLRSRRRTKTSSHF